MPQEILSQHIKPGQILAFSGSWYRVLSSEPKEFAGQMRQSCFLKFTGVGKTPEHSEFIYCPRHGLRETIADEP